MTHTIAVNAIPDWLADETRGGVEDTAVMAGHFALFSAGGTASDLLDDVTTAPSGAAEMLDFTRRTWYWACRAAAIERGAAFRKVVLVDDIQFVRPVTNDRALAERLADALARDYLGAVRTLPQYHLRELASHGLGPERVVRNSDDRWLFSERELRRSAVHRVRRHFSSGGGSGAGLASADNGNTMTVSLAEQGDYCLVHSGHTTCAGGYIELLSTMFERGVRKFISFVPMRCLGQVALGTELAHRLFPLAGLEVVNVAIQDPGVSDSAVIDRTGTSSARPAY